MLPLLSVCIDNHYCSNCVVERENAMYNFLSSGKLKGHRNGRTWRIPKLAVREFILENSKIKVREERVRGHTPLLLLLSMKKVLLFSVSTFIIKASKNFHLFMRI